MRIRGAGTSCPGRSPGRSPRRTRGWVSCRATPTGRAAGSVTSWASQVRPPAAAPAGRSTSSPVADHAVIGYCHPGFVRAEFCASLISAVMEGKTLLDSVLTYESGPNISTARNKITNDFLRNQRAPWLLMCDTDMVFAADALDRLIAAADPVERPLLGALCHSPASCEGLPA